LQPSGRFRRPSVKVDVRHKGIMTDIPRDWLRQKGTPQEFEQARLQRTAAAFNLPF